MQAQLSQAIEREFLAAKKVNPAFSLRAMARRLRLSPGALAEILAGKRRVSPALCARICERLAVDPATRERIVNASRPSAKRKAQVSYAQLSTDQFDLIASPEHFQILSLMRTKGFRSDEAWIANRLGLPRAKVRRALTRLRRLGLVREEAGKLVRTPHAISTPDNIANSSLRHANRRSLERAIEELDRLEPSERDTTTYLTVGSPEQLETVKRMIREFQDELSAVLEEGPRTDVYQLSIQFFPLTDRRSQ